MVSLILASALLIFVYMTGLFLIALARRDNSLADIGWGIGFILVAALSLVLEPGWTFRRMLVDVLVTAWGLRLAVYVFLRNRKRGEDFRYAKWRREWGRSFVLRSYLQVFMLQGLILLIIAYPIILVSHSPDRTWTLLDTIGFVVWIVGIFFETVGDEQLRRFRREPANRGRIITSGLWKTTRHPNYFGEATMWWGIFLIALSAPDGWTAVISPAVITFMLLRVSGVTMLEKKYADNPDFAAYARKTSAFVPWFPKKPKEGGKRT